MKKIVEFKNKKKEEILNKLDESRERLGHIEKQISLKLDNGAQTTEEDWIRALREVGTGARLINELKELNNDPPPQSEDDIIMHNLQYLENQ